MKWFSFSQNNSGGSFDGPREVMVEASSASQANNIAESYGVYFEGCNDGIDCPCCGDRWSIVYESSATDEPLYPLGVSERELAAIFAKKPYNMFLGESYTLRWIPFGKPSQDVTVELATYEKAVANEKLTRLSLFGFRFHKLWESPSAIYKVTEPQSPQYDGSFFDPKGYCTWWADNGNDGVLVAKSGDPGVVSHEELVYVTAATEAELEPIRKEMQKVLAMARKAARSSVAAHVAEHLDPEIMKVLREKYMA